RNAHGRAHWTTEEARRVIASTRKAIGHDEEPRIAKKSPLDRAGAGDHTLDLSQSGQPDGTAESAAAESIALASPPTTTEPTAGGWCGDDIDDPVVAATASGMSADRLGPGDGEAGSNTASAIHETEPQVDNDGHPVGGFPGLLEVTGPHGGGSEPDQVEPEIEDIALYDDLA